MSSDPSYYSASRFESNVQAALVSVRKILDNTRNPQMPADVSHKYQDKYTLAEYLTNVAVAALGITLEEATCDRSALSPSAKGLNDDTWKILRDLANSGAAVNLRFLASEKTVFDKETSRKIEGPEYTTERESSLFGKSKTTEKVVTTVKEWTWKFSYEWKLQAYSGVHSEEKNSILLASSSGGGLIVSTTETRPRPENVVRSPLDINITWLIQQLSVPPLQARFHIDRTKDTCRTPRRNDDIDAAFSFFAALCHWNDSVLRYFTDELGRVIPSSQLPYQLSSLDNLQRQIFNPVLPLFEDSARLKKVDEQKSQANGPFQLVDFPSESIVQLSKVDANAFLNELKRSSSEAVASLDKVFAGVDAKNKLFSQFLIRFLVHIRHVRSIAFAWADGVNYIEQMLRDQFLAAIGRALTPTDFNEYMRFHAKKIFRPAFQPAPFAFAVRRGAQFPEGTLSIDYKPTDGSITNAQPVESFVRKLPSFPMQFSLNASTKIRFHGERYAHGLLFNSFESSNGVTLALNARARQFSSFLLCLGSLQTAEDFAVKSAIVVQNRDELSIPLLCEAFPSAKEFKDAISSLSPEQQRFCKQYRKMQLSSSLFAVVVLQIKPQVERAMNLSSCALIKEIKLTQDILEQFLQYQIPTDMMAYDALVDGNGDARAQIQAVRKHVDDLQAIVKTFKNTQLHEVELRADFALESAVEISTDECEAYDEEDCDDGAVLASVEMTEAPKKMGRFRKMLSRKASPRAKVKEERKEKEKDKMKEKGSAQKKMARSEDFKKRDVSASPSVSSTAPSASSLNASQTAELTKQSQQHQQHESKSSEQDASAPAEKADHVDELIDLTNLPNSLDSAFEELDLDGCVRPTTISTGPTWTKLSYESLLSSAATSYLTASEQDRERARAFDLVDALSRSGALVWEEAALHVVVAATHCFTNSLIDTIVKENVNPIEKMERTQLILAGAIHQTPATKMLKEDAVEDVKKYSAPNIFQLEEAEVAAEEPK